MPSPQTTYVCYHCHHALYNICNIGPARRLWCGRCGCTRLHVRADPREHITAASWPPAARKEPRP